MNQLYPIIRRARRSLWPEGEPQKETKATKAEAPAVVTSVEAPLHQAQEVSAPVVREADAVAEPSVVETVKDESHLTSAATGGTDGVLPGIELAAKKTKQRGKKRSTSNAQLPTNANDPQ